MTKLLVAGSSNSSFKAWLKKSNKKSKVVGGWRGARHPQTFFSSLFSLHICILFFRVCLRFLKIGRKLSSWLEEGDFRDRKLFLFHRTKNWGFELRLLTRRTRNWSMKNCFLLSFICKEKRECKKQINKYQQVWRKLPPSIPFLGDEENLMTQKALVPGIIETKWLLRRRGSRENGELREKGKLMHGRLLLGSTPTSKNTSLNFLMNFVKNS